MKKEEEKEEEEEGGKIKDKKESALTRLKFPFLSASQLDRHNPKEHQHRGACSPNTKLQKMG